MEQYEDRIDWTLDELKEVWKRNPQKSFFGILRQCNILPATFTTYISDVEVMIQLGRANTTTEKLKYELSNRDTTGMDTSS